jgi:acyl-CoA dehydrogenase
MTDTIITDTATRIFRDLCDANTVNAAEKGEWPAALWNALEEAGLTLAWVADDLGGAGAEIGDGFAVARVAGRFAAPLPLVETLFAGWLLAQAGIAAPPGPMTIAPVHRDGRITLDADGRLRGRARSIPFARSAGHIAVLLATGDGVPHVALVAAAGLAISHAASLAGEPSDTVGFDGATALAVAPAPGLDSAAIARIGAALRAQQMAGALETALDLAVQYAMDRTQFGRPIAKFQAVQHNLATLAGEAAAAGAAADAASEAIATHGAADAAEAAVAIAKLRAGEAAGSGAAIAHQVHGAMGFTYEHSLHHSTRRLWAWREEFGNETLWAGRLGRLVAAEGADALWPFVTAGS